MEPADDGHGDGDCVGDVKSMILEFGDRGMDSLGLLEGDGVRVAFRGLMALQTEHRILSGSLSKVHRVHCH